MLSPGPIAISSDTTILGAPASTVTYTHEYIHVPANVESRPDFQRWLRLR
jgi:hypothetical protein